LKSSFADLQASLGYVFQQARLLEQALTHRSFSATHYERLEFLGDSVLNLAVSILLYERLDRQTEGDLSRIRANLVKQDTLHALALSLHLPEHLRLGEGEVKSGGRQRPSILADALEAVIGAVYLDGGFDPAQQLVRRLFADVDLSPGQSAQGKDAKTALQEWLQGRKMKLPVYSVVGTQGEAHQQIFDVICEVTEWSSRAQGQGPSRRAAEQAAAAAMLALLKKRQT
jgi:ribonuclease-3